MQKFKDLKTLQKYTEKHGRFQEGELVQTSDDDKFYIYKDGWNEIKGKIENNSNIEMNLYDLNKQIMSQMESFDIKKWEQAEKDIAEWDQEIAATYYMLLCKELSYYTVFVNDGYEFHNLGSAIRECLEFVGGDTVSVDIEPDRVEIWIKQEEDTYCFYLFNYDAGIVSFKR